MSSPMQNSTTNPIPIWQGTRPHGRPRGSKNGPNAGAVGRPQKNGQPPNKMLLVCPFLIYWMIGSQQNLNFSFHIGQQRSHDDVGRPQGDNLTMLSRKLTRPNHEKYHVTVDRARLLMISRCYRATRVAGGNCRSLRCSTATRLNKFLLSENPLAPEFYCSTGICIFYHHVRFPLQ